MKRTYFKRAPPLTSTRYYVNTSHHQLVDQISSSENKISRSAYDVLMASPTRRNYINIQNTIRRDMFNFAYISKREMTSFLASVYVCIVLSYCHSDRQSSKKKKKKNRCVIWKIYRKYTSIIYHWHCKQTFRFTRRSLFNHRESSEIKIIEKKKPPNTSNYRSFVMARVFVN